MGDVVQPKSSKVIGENADMDSATKIPDNINQQNQQNQPVPEPLNTPNQSKDTSNKQKKNKSMLLFIFKGTVVISFIFMLLFVAILILGAIFPKSTLIPEIDLANLNPNNTPDEPPVVEIFDPGPIPTLVEYTNALNRFTFKYPDQAHFSVNEDSVPNLYKVVYSRLNPSQESIVDNELKDGYIFKILVYPDFRDANIQTLSNEKRTSYTYSCPPESKISTVEARKFKDNDSFYFNVEDCNNIEYRETFVKKDEIVYEIVQLYTGDLGYRQQHFARTEEMKDSFVFLRKSEVEKDPEWVPFQVSTTVKFMHPSLESCCTLLEKLPIDVTPKIILGFTDDVGFGVYTASLDRGREAPLPFDEFLANVRRKLEENYILVTERAPSKKESLTAIGNQTGYLFEDYAWWGPIMFVKAPRENTVIIISSIGDMNETQRETFNKILESFTF